MRKMAALFNRTDFWNLGIDAAMNAYIANHQKEFITFAWIQGVVLCFVSLLTTFGNAFVIYASWRDPFKNLHSWPAHLLLQSSVVADLLVGLALAPMQEYWLFSQLEAQTSALSFHIILSLASILIGVSVAHVLLLTVDRLFAIMKPFRHKCIATRQRIRLAVLFLWLYYICFGIMLLCLKDRFFIVNIVFIVQMFITLQLTFCFYGVMVYRLRRNYKEWHQRILRGSVHVTHHEQYTHMEGRLVRSIAFVICFSLFFITPFFVLIFLLYFCRQCYFHPQMVFVFVGVETTLQFLISALRPLVYCWRISKYREIFRYYFQAIVRSSSDSKRTCKQRKTFDTKL